MDSNINIKNVMMLLLVLVFTASSVNASATVIDLQTNNEPEPNYQNVVELINQYDIVELVANNYNSIAVNINDTTENFSVVLNFGDGKLQNISDYDGSVVDLSLSFTRDDVKYLMNNWESMSKWDKVLYLINNTDMPIKDILTFSGIAMGVRI